MQTGIEEFIRQLFSLIQLLRIYPHEHPKLKGSFDETFIALKKTIRGKKKLIVGIVGKEIVFEKQIFFNLSRRFQSTIIEFKNRGIEKFVFHENLNLLEFISFSKILAEKDLKVSSYKDYMKLKGIENIEVDKVRAAVSGSKVVKGGTDADYLAGIYGTFSDMLVGKNLDIVKLKSGINNFLENIYSNQKIFMEASLIKNYDVSTFLHSVNVALLSMFFVAKLGYTKDEILEVGIAGLFHDVGKIAISEKIIKKPAVLTDEELAEVKNHPHLGAKILFKYVDSLGILPVVVSFEHHRDYDSGGYPKISTSIAPNFISLIVGICDFYDALRSRRAYKSAVSPEVIYQIMEKAKGKKFEPYLLERFFQEIGVYPIGTLVILSNENVVLVREQNKKDVFRPKVEVVTPVELKGRLIDLSKDMNISIKSSID